MTKPLYHHPECVLSTADKRIPGKNKRLWLSLTIDENRAECLVVILKNPSRSTKDISDKTIFTVTNYVYKNREKYKQLKNIGTLIILNLIPFYETYLDQLVNSNFTLADKENIKTIKDITSKHKKVIIAWGNHPKGLFEQYGELKDSVIDILKTNNNEVFYVDRLTKNGNPKHGQVWGYGDRLRKMEL